jgi:hypothetical protein
MTHRTLTHVGQRKTKERKFDPNVVVAFYCRDDNSRMTAGKKETRTWKGQKKQISYLLFSMETLFLKFCAEYGNDVISRYINLLTLTIKSKIFTADHC